MNWREYMKLRGHVLCVEVCSELEGACFVKWREYVMW